MFKKANGASYDEQAICILSMALHRSQLPGPCLESLSQLPRMMDYIVYSELSSFLPLLLLVVVFCHSNRDPDKDTRESFCYTSLALKEKWVQDRRLPVTADRIKL